jgi:hypothetical protein
MNLNDKDNNILNENILNDNLDNNIQNENLNNNNLDNNTQNEIIENNNSQNENLNNNILDNNTQIKNIVNNNLLNNNSKNENLENDYKIDYETFINKKNNENLKNKILNRLYNYNNNKNIIITIEQKKLLNSLAIQENNNINKLIKEHDNKIENINNIENEIQNIGVENNNKTNEDLKYEEEIRNRVLNRIKIHKKYTDITKTMDKDIIEKFKYNRNNIIEPIVHIPKRIISNKLNCPANIINKNNIANLINNRKIQIKLERERKKQCDELLLIKKNIEIENNKIMKENYEKNIKKIEEEAIKKNQKMIQKKIYYVNFFKK